jgi:hypothetical protein
MTLKVLTFLLLLAPSSLPLNAQVSKELDAATPKHGLASIRPGYAGDEACVACHREQSLSYAHTAHRLTSQLPSKESVLGNFQPGTNVLTISDPATHPAEPALFFKMEVKDGGFYQTAVTGWGDQLQTMSERIDLVTGSGARGQTYLYWLGDKLFELPVSYWSDGHQWINSPGYVDGTVDFSRQIHPGCLECHASYIRPLSPDPLTNRYEKSTLVTGISCETCHGPAAEHVARFTRPKTAGSGETAILNPAKLSRDLQVDSCAYCHSGIQRVAVGPAFSFTPGKPLSEYFKAFPQDTAEHPDVHGNQVGLLKRSRCYQSSAEMSCSTCHNTHAPEQAASSYSSRCLQCHQWTSCPVSKKLGHAIANNCIDCHMPIEATNVIVSESSGNVVRAKMRNHWIKIYPESTAP